MSTAIRLLQDWNGFRNGTVLPIVPDGQANVMIERGIARKANEVEATDMANARLCDDLPIEAAEPKAAAKVEEEEKPKKSRRRSKAKE